jgi:hypothetical protein
MAFTGKSIADGQVATSWAAIFTAAAKVIIKSCDFLNTNAAQQTIEVGVTRSGSSRRIVGRAVLDQNEKYALVSDGEALVLSSGDTLDAQTTTATAVDFTVTGADE